MPALAKLPGRLKPGGSRTMTLEAFEGHDLRIQVVDLDLLPVNHAQVELAFRNKSLSGTDRVATTDASGFATLTHVDQPIRILAHKRGLVSVNQLRGKLKPDGQEVIEPLVLAPETIQTGRIIDVEGRPVEGAEVTIEIVDDVRSLNIKHGSMLRSFPKTWVLSSEADGSYDVPDVPRAPLTIQIRKAGLRTGSTRIEAPGGGLAVTLKPYPRFFGKAVDPDSVPIADALVQLVTEEDTVCRVVGETRTDDSGSFDLEISEDLAFRQVECFLRASHPKFIPTIWRILDPKNCEAEPLTLTLQPGALFVGEVLEEDGTPVSDALISLDADYEANWRLIPPRTQTGSLLNSVVHHRADASGQFQMQNVSPGAHSVLVHRPGKLRPSLVTELTEGATEAHFVLPPFETEDTQILGKLVDAETDAALPDGVIKIDYLFGSGTDKPASYPIPEPKLDSVNAQGAFEFFGLQSGLMHITASAAGYESPHFLPIEVEPGSHEFEIRLNPLRTVSINLTLPPALTPEMVTVSIWELASNAPGSIPRKRQMYRLPRSSGWVKNPETGSYRVIFSRVPASEVSLTVESDHLLFEKLFDLREQLSAPLEVKVTE